MLLPTRARRALECRTISGLTRITPWRSAPTPQARRASEDSKPSSIILSPRHTGQLHHIKLDVLEAAASSSPSRAARRISYCFTTSSKRIRQNQVQSHHVEPHTLTSVRGRTSMSGRRSLREPQTPRTVTPVCIRSRSVRAEQGYLLPLLHYRHPAVFTSGTAPQGSA